MVENLNWAREISNLYLFRIPKNTLKIPKGTIFHSRKVSKIWPSLQPCYSLCADALLAKRLALANCGKKVFKTDWRLLQSGRLREALQAGNGVMGANRIHKAMTLQTAKPIYVNAAIQPRLDEASPSRRPSLLVAKKHDKTSSSITNYAFISELMPLWTLEPL